MRKIGGFVALAVALTLTAGCSASSSSESSSKTPPPLDKEQMGTPDGFESYYSQQVNWRACEAEEITPSLSPRPSDLSAYECGTLKAPLDWEDSKSIPIELGVARYVPGREGAARQPLFFNLGGPGGDAVNSLSSVVNNIFTDNVTNHFQVVALDPRGVGVSTPVQCLTDEERAEEEQESISLDGMSPQERTAWYQTEMSELGNKCLEKSGEILGFVDTHSAAKDFDMARAVLGFEKMDYVGYSYGTLLGLTYADLFPTHVGRFVLDGVMDPAMTANEVSASQLQGMEESLYHWIEYCQAEGKCPLPGDLEGGKQWLIEFINGVEENPIPTGDPDRPLSANLAGTAIIGSLYSTETYPLLKEGLAAGAAGDGSTLLFLADFFNDREADGTYASNSSDAFMAINALDYEPVGTPEDWERDRLDLEARFPVLGKGFGFASAGLDSWPVKSSTPRRPLSAEGAPEMLLVGTTHDPATPYVMAENVNQAIDNTVLLTVEGWNHGAYRRSSPKCVTSIVDTFLINGELPAPGTVCD